MASFSTRFAPLRAQRCQIIGRASVTLSAISLCYSFSAGEVLPLASAVSTSLVAARPKRFERKTFFSNKIALVVRAPLVRERNAVSNPSIPEGFSIRVCIGNIQTITVRVLLYIARASRIRAAFLVYINLNFNSPHPRNFASDKASRIRVANLKHAFLNHRSELIFDEIGITAIRRLDKL